jgi:hypothetical protein
MPTRRCSRGCFDDEFKAESVRFFEEVRQGQFVVVVSNVTLDELELAPDRVRGVLADLPPQQVEIVSMPHESDDLRRAYLEAAVVGPRRATTLLTLPWRPFPTWIW